MKRMLIAILFLISAPVFSMSLAYDVTVRNDAKCSLQIEFLQYHAVGFDGTRPPALTKNLLTGPPQVVTVESATTTKVQFTDAAGGFWVAWRVMGKGACISRHGTIDLIQDEKSIHIP